MSFNISNRNLLVSLWGAIRSSPNGTLWLESSSSQRRLFVSSWDHADPRNTLNRSKNENSVGSVRIWSYSKESGLVALFDGMLCGTWSELHTSADAPLSYLSIIYIISSAHSLPWWKSKLPQKSPDYDQIN